MQKDSYKNGTFKFLPITEPSDVDCLEPDQGNKVTILFLHHIYCR